MRRLLAILPFAMAALGLMGAAILRSPKDSATQPRKVSKQVAPPTLHQTVTNASAKALVTKTNHPFHITLMCDPVHGAIGYHWYRGSNSLPEFTSAVFTVNNWVTESNLWPGINYEFAATAVGTNAESNFSPIVHWPQSRTNFLALGVSALETDSWTANTIITNPPTGFYRLHLQAGMYALHSSPNFQVWTTVTNWPIVAPMPTFYLRASKWDNVTGLEHPD